jgi:DNA-binding MarR family transcriptional regulator
MPEGPSADRVPLAILVTKAGTLVHNELLATLAETGLRLRHCQLLMHLSEAGSTTQQDLLEALELDASVLVGLLNDLEGDGYVKRLRDPADRRRHIVKLSDRGAQQWATVAEKIAAVEAAVFAGVSAADVEALRRALQLVWTSGRADSACS